MRFLGLLFALPGLFALAGHAAVNEDAFSSAQRWAAAKFLGVDEPLPSAGPYLTVQPKPDALLRDRIQGQPLLIVDRKFDRGLAMRSPGEITVELPSGARTFEAALGVDSNDVGYYSNAGRGSVVASVESNGRTLYQSPVLHEGIQAISLYVDLDGARKITLRLRAVGARSPIDQAEWDQADWANASVILTDGSRLSLSDLPLGPRGHHYSLSPPFSFRYGDQSSGELLTHWPVERKTRQLDDRRSEYTSVYRDPATHLTVRCIAILYRDFPTVEWTVYLKNEGSARTPILQDIEALDTGFEGEGDGNSVLHHSKGSSDSASDYEPLETSLKRGAEERFSSIGGRPTDGDMPYFNLAWPGHGVIFALGWPGQWALSAKRDQSTRVQIRGGQQLTHFWLAPGEEVRTPLSVVQFWDGDWIDGQNVWRRWMVAHNLPRPGGKLPAPLLAASSGRFTIEMQGANQENQEEYIDRTLKAGLPADYWWMDAGWYPFTLGWWKTGTWDPDPKRFPHRFRPVDDYAHARHLKIIVWFEPERVTEGSWLDRNHPEWLLGEAGKDRLLFLGNPDAWRWLVDHVSGMIARDGIDVYRQDFNFPPLALWRAHDAADRQGITEIEHVEGYLAYFDELRKRFPQLLIDTCASGGRRNDLETLRRAVPLWRSDYPYKPVSQQGQTYGLSLWVPYFGTAMNSVDPYVFRSQMAPALGLGLALQTMEDNRQTLLPLLSEWRDIARFCDSDFIPLTQYSLDSSAWIAWQRNRPSQGTGAIEAFRREDSPFVSARFRLRGLNPSARYVVKNLDTSEESEFTGAQLMEQGLDISIESAPGSELYLYRERASGSHGPRKETKAKLPADTR